MLNIIQFLLFYYTYIKLRLYNKTFFTEFNFLFEL